VVFIAAPLVYVFQFVPLSILKRYWSDAPVDPPVPALKVTVPVLNPAQIVEPFAGLAEERAGATGAFPTVQVHTVLHVEVEHP
jgi:hypothetical protein